MIGIQDLFQKPTLAQYRQKLVFKQRLSVAIGLLMTGVSHQLVLTDLARGFLLGFGVTILIGSFYYQSLLRREQALKERYIRTYDERGRLIWALSLQLAFLLLSGILLALFLCYAFTGVAFDYGILLLGLLYVMGLAIIGFRFLLEKWM